MTDGVDVRPPSHLAGSAPRDAGQPAAPERCELDTGAARFDFGRGVFVVPDPVQVLAALEELGAVAGHPADTGTLRRMDEGYKRAMAGCHALIRSGDGSVPPDAEPVSADALTWTERYALAQLLIAWEVRLGNAVRRMQGSAPHTASQSAPQGSRTPSGPQGSAPTVIG